MATRLQHRYAAAANVNELLIAEDSDGVCLGIGTIEELEALIADGIMPETTILREARAEDF